MSLFKETLTIGLEESEKLIFKKVNLDISKKKVDFIVKPNSILILSSLPNMEFPGNNNPYSFTREQLTNKKLKQCDAYLFTTDDILLKVPFFGGTFSCSLAQDRRIKATFSLVGTTYLEIFDRFAFASLFDNKVSISDAEAEIIKRFRDSLSNEIKEVAQKYIKENTTADELAASINSIINDLVTDSQKTSKMIRNYGLRISRRGTSMHVNALEDTEELLKEVNDKIKNVAIFEIDEPIRNNEDKRLKDQRDFEINKIKAQRSTVTEKTENINKNITGNNTKDDEKNTFKYCPSCGKELPSAKFAFCPYCGSKIKKGE